MSLLLVLLAQLLSWAAIASFILVPFFSTVGPVRATPATDAQPLFPLTRPQPEFVFDLDHDVATISGAVLTYQTRWTDNPALVRRAINGHAALGGYVSYSEGSSKELAEPIPAALLRKGVNTVSFLPNTFRQHPEASLPRLLIRWIDRSGRTTDSVVEPRGNGVSHNQLRLGSIDAPAASVGMLWVDRPNAYRQLEQSDPIEILYPTDSTHHGDRTLIRGRVRTDAELRAPVIRVAGRAVPHEYGQFEAIIERPDTFGPTDSWNISVSVSYSNGSSFQRQLTLARRAPGLSLDRPAEELLALDDRRPSARVFGTEVALAKPDESVELTIRCNRYLETPAADRGMINATSGPCASLDVRKRKGSSPVTIRLPARLENLPFGYEPKRALTFSYDDARHIWLAQADSFVDVENKTTVSTLRDQSAKLVTGVLKLDDGIDVKPSLHERKGLDEISQVDVLGGHVRIDPPAISPQGTARTRMPALLRPLRGNLGSLFEINYDSSGGNGLLGQGWTLDVPFISVDTKWGVPAYHPTKETETYLSGGKELLAFRNDDARLERPYLPHRMHPEDRAAFYRPGDVTEFRYRRDEGYERIVRHGTSPDKYWWEIVFKNGVREFYGANPADGANR